MVLLSTFSPAVELPPLVVPVRPSLLVEPSGVVSTQLAKDAIELAGVAGLDLDEWQKHDLTVMMGQRSDGRWAAAEHAEIVARQNGKGSILEVRELAGLFLLEERLILHSAHLAVTATEAQNRLLTLIENCPDLDRMVQRVSRSSQDQSITTKRGGRVMFKTRTKGGGRGLTGDCVVLDEGMYLYWQQMAALMPTISARPNPQIIYASSAAEAESEVLHKVRRRALSGEETSLGYCEYACSPDADPSLPQTWADANPALGIRITLDYLEREHASLPADQFSRERLTLFDQDRTEAGSWAVIGEDTWKHCGDPASTITSRVALSIEVDRERTCAVVAASGRNQYGKFHVEIVDQRDGVDWVVGRTVGVVNAESNDVAVVAVDPGGPAGFLINPLIEAGVKVVPVSSRDAAQACGLFLTSAVSSELVHLNDSVLSKSVQSAVRRDSGDVWYWKRTGDDESIGLLAATLALGQVPTLPESDAGPAPVYAY